jgi:hypothetical protein
VAWLQNGEAPRFAHLPLFSLSLLLTSLWILLYLWTKYGTHTHTICFFSFFLVVFYWKYLFSLPLGPLQNMVELGMDTHPQCGVKCTMLQNTRKATLKGQGHQRKRGCQRRRKCKEEENLHVPVWAGFTSVWTGFNQWPTLAGVQTGFSRFRVFRKTWSDLLFSVRSPAIARSGFFFVNSSSLMAEIGNKNPQIQKK